MLSPAITPKQHSRASILARLISALRVFICFICLLVVVHPIRTRVLAQEPELPDEEVVRVNTDLLLFPVRIRNKRGQLETKLTEQDLILKDKDHVTTGLYFYPGADRVALVFALDQSGSLRDIVAQQRDASLALFGRFSERSRVAVYRFSETPTLVTPFGRDAQAVREAFNFPAEANRHTAIFNAAAAAVNAFEGLVRVRSERRIVILISDGLDNASTIKAASIVETALEKRVSFYVIHLPLFEPRNGRLAVRSPAKGFRELAEKTGGKYFLVGDARSALMLQRNLDLTSVFQAIEDDLKSQYLLGFYLGETTNDGRKHRFSVTLPSGYEYQVGRVGYSRRQEFFVERPREALKVSK
jgi:VWFA-related protein